MRATMAVNYGEIVLTFRAFARHASECDPCSDTLVAIQLNSDPASFNRWHLACCEVGTPLLEAWKYACDVAVRAYREAR